MKMNIQTPNFRARKSLTIFVQEKVGKLVSFSDRILESCVFLKLENSSTRKNKVCEIKLMIPGNDLFASSQSETFEGAVFKAVEAIKPQLERWKKSRQRSSLV